MLAKVKRAPARLAANETRWNLALVGAHIGVFDIDFEQTYRRFQIVGVS
jgi:hypothetical protein